MFLFFLKKACIKSVWNKIMTTYKSNLCLYVFGTPNKFSHLFFYNNPSALSFEMCFEIEN